MVEYKYDAWGNHAALYRNKVNDKEQYSDVDEAAFDENYAQNKTLAELNPFRYRGYYYDDETGLYIVGVAAVVLSDGIALFALF